MRIRARTREQTRFAYAGHGASGITIVECKIRNFHYSISHWKTTNNIMTRVISSRNRVFSSTKYLEMSPVCSVSDNNNDDRQKLSFDSETFYPLTPYEYYAKINISVQIVFHGTHSPRCNAKINVFPRRTVQDTETTTFARHGVYTTAAQKNDDSACAL